MGTGKNVKGELAQSFLNFQLFINNIIMRLEVVPLPNGINVESTDPN